MQIDICALKYIDNCNLATNVRLGMKDSQYKLSSLSGVYTGEKTLHVVAVASDSDLKRWEDFY